VKTYTDTRGYQEHEIGQGDAYRGEAYVRVDGRPLDPRLDLANHSPTGFEWGYNGSGPAQLALALLADALGDDDEALCWYQHYKESVVSALRHDEWSLTEREIRWTVNALRSRDPARAARFDADKPARAYIRHLKGCATCKAAENGEAPDFCAAGKPLFEAWEKSEARP
jgi:hypothetical protein